MQNKLSDQKRVVITGIGAVSPLGLTALETWKNLCEGNSGIDYITQFDTADYPVKIAGEVKNYDVTKLFSSPVKVDEKKSILQAANPKDAKRIGRFVHFALSAGLEAYAQSGLSEIRSASSNERMGVNIGVGIGGLKEIELVHLSSLEKGPSKITPFFITQVIANMPSGYLSILLNLKGMNTCNVSACASSAQSISEAARLIQSGEMDVMLAGGAEATVCGLAIGGFAAMKALSTYNNHPQKASRPFDRTRNGFVLSEGAAVLVLEEYEHAKKRNANILGELKGYASTADAYHVTAPSIDGEGGRRSMILALQNAQLNPEQIDYVNAHSTSTPLGDAEEAKAIAAVFANCKKQVLISATKSLTGHLLGAAGALEACITLMSIQEGIVPPTVNLDELDPQIKNLNLNILCHKSQKKPINFALSNSFGFGGTNVSLVFGKV